MRIAGFARPTLLLLTTLATAACGSHHHGPEVIGPLDGNSFVVRDVRVFDGERAIERTNVVVREGIIAAVGDDRPPRELPVIDGTGRTLFPGLIDSHAHVQSEPALRNALRFGVTTELDMFTIVEFAGTQRPRRSSMARTDLADFYSAGAPVTSPGGMGTQFGIPFPTIAGPEEADAFVRARLAEGSDYIKILHEPGAGIVTSISRETLRAVVAAAHRQGALAVAHVSSLAGARDVVAAGADGLVHVFSDSMIDDELAARMAAQHMFVTPTLSIFAAFRGQGIGPELAADPRLSPYVSDAQRAQLARPVFDPNDPMAPYLARFDLARAIENVRRLNAAGVRILAGDDVPNLAAHGVSMHGELELLTRAGLTPAEALGAATGATAVAYRLADRGRIAVGARADLVLVDGNPLEDITATRAIVRVFKNGYEVSRSPASATAAAATPAAAATAAAVSSAARLDGERIRVRLMEQSRAVEGSAQPQILRGSFVGATRDTLLMRVHPAAGVIAIAREGIERLDVSGGVRSRLESAAVGGATLGLFGALERVVLATLDDDRFGAETTVESALIGAAYGAALGLATGAIFPQERWKRMRSW